MPPSPAAAVAAFVRRAFVGAFFGGLSRAVLVGAGAAAALQVMVRLAGGYLAPHPLWCTALAPAVLFAWWSAQQERLTGAAAAGHLDQRLELHGLLLCAHEGLPLESAWQQRLAERLLLARTVLPVVQWRRLLQWPALAVLLAVAVALLPPPPAPPPPRQQAAVAAEMERLTESLRDLLARGAVPDESRQELEKKLQELQERLAKGEMPEWRDLDQLEQRLEREQLLQAAAEQSGKQGAEGPDAGKTTAAKVTPKQVAAAGNAMAAANLLDELPADLRAMLFAAKGQSGFDPAGLPQDAEALQRLAEAMAAAALQAGAEEALKGLDPGQLADLAGILEAFPGDGELGASEGEAGLDGEGVGRGGVDRGPGHAALSMTEDAQGGADAAMALPPGVAAPTEWVPLGSRPSEPDVRPENNRAPGSAGAAGAGGASWQLHLAPRHRAVVQRFFGDAGKVAPDGVSPPAKDKR